MHRRGKMFNFESGRLVNREVESALEEVQDVLNLVDILARSTGQFLNSVNSTSEQCFSDNVSHWLFEKKQGTSFAVIRRREKEIRAAAEAHKHQCSDTATRGTGDTNGQNVEANDGSTPSNRPRYDLDEMRRQEDARNRCQPTFSHSGSSADGQNFASSYYSSQLLSHQVSSNTAYASPRSRYFHDQDLAVSSIRQRLAAISTKPRPKSACELVGPIASDPPKFEPKKRSSGVTVSISGGNYSNVRSSLARSKSMFEDFAGPSNPYYKSPWERTQNGRARLNQSYR